MTAGTCKAFFKRLAVGFIILTLIFFGLYYLSCFHARAVSVAIIAFFLTIAMYIIGDIVCTK